MFLVMAVPILIFSIEKYKHYTALVCSPLWEPPSYAKACIKNVAIHRANALFCLALVTPFALGSPGINPFFTAFITAWAAVSFLTLLTQFLSAIAPKRLNFNTWC
jgi:hypothetical protein